MRLRFKTFLDLVIIKKIIEVESSIATIVYYEYGDKETSMVADFYYTFDDVLIAPSFSDIESRSEIDTSVDFLGLKLTIPFISSNMDYVTGPTMAHRMHTLGGLGILHRFVPWETQLEYISALHQAEVPIIISVGIRDLKETMEHIKQAEGIHGVCIDVAHGHHAKVAQLLELIKGSPDDNIAELQVIAGNVASLEGVGFLYEAGADAAKVGIGAGSVCTTRTVAGVGIPQMSAIIECVAAKEELKDGIKIIADGGFRYSGDIAKALAAGADAVMVGNLFAGTDETPGDVFDNDGKKYKRYRGQASFGSNGERYVKEGIEGIVPYKGPLEPIVHKLRAGLQSSMSYVGARNLAEFAVKAKFVEVSSHTMMENSTRVEEIVDGSGKE